MPQGTRKLIGAVLLLTLVVGYALIAMTIGGALAIGLPEYLRLPFYLVAGLLWVLPAMVIVRWMQRP